MFDQTLLDVLWIIISAFLVLLMQAGFLCVETGLTRSKNNINVAIKNSIDFSISLIAFSVMGYAVMFGEWLPGWIGPLEPVAWKPEDPFFMAFFLFQALFCSTAVTIVSGMVAERIRFGGYILFSLILASLIYPLMGHWAWNGIDGGTGQGWLAAAGFVDWAGSTVVHSTGGWFGLALLLIIGPRKGRFGPNGEVNEIIGSNLPLTALGVLILWFGWIGFNGGSTLALNYTIVPVVVNTCIAAAAGGLGALLVDWLKSGKAHVMPSLNGILAGLVSITAAAHAVTLMEAIIIGAMGGAIAYLADLAMLRMRIDDSVGAFPVHVMGGVWGTLAVALFGDPNLLGTGLSAFDQFLVQGKGILACWVIAFLIPFIVLLILKPWTRIRVTDEEEQVGLNVSEHGARSELHDFFLVLSEQEITGNMSLRAPSNPFTEIGQIGAKFNSVMDALEQSVSKINAIVSHSADAIITFNASGGAVLSHNPAAQSMFGLPGDNLHSLSLGKLVPELDNGGFATGKRLETQGHRLDKKKVPLEAMLVEAQYQKEKILIATFRDITERKEAHRHLIESEERFRSVYENAALGMALVNENLEIVDANPALLSMLGLSWDEAFSANLCGITHPEDLDTISDHVRKVLSDSQNRHITEVRCLCKSQLMIWARLAFSKFHLEKNIGPLAIVIVEDITNQKHAENAIRLSASVFESTTEPIVIFNANGLIEQVNKAFKKAFELRDSEVRGLKIRHLLSARYQTDFFDEVEEKLRTDQTWQGEMMGRRSDQTLMPLWVSLSLVHDAKKKLQNRVAILTDLSEQKEREETIWRHANFDTLTKLPNRRLFQDRLDQSLGQAKRTGARIGLFFIDLDRFKLVNDTMGHQAGDELLQRVAERINHTVRSTDTVARLGGDEFTVILQNFNKSTELSQIASSIIEEVEKPLMLEAGEASVSASIGIAAYPVDAQDTQELIRCADSALYQAKDAGRNTYQFFTEELNQALIDQVKLEKNLRHAIENNELFMLYQPQLETQTSSAPCAEALVRWRTPDGGMISPGDFIPLAEETGLIIPLGSYVIRAVCRDIRQWMDQGYSVPQVAINASAKQFHYEQGLPKLIENICKEERVPLKSISIEITENSIMSNEKESLDVLNQLSEMGVSISLDDFGTGYSSLSRLKQLPIGVLKLDRSFVAGIPESQENTALVTAIVQMAHALGLSVVAEGVETETELEYLRQLDCEKIQGYLISRPVSAEECILFCNEFTLN
ncbi:MAG: ammonium transporter [Magnetococcales bacterium]|nr:ammonium transporter [Magnetococcales bacterium]